MKSRLSDPIGYIYRFDRERLAAFFERVALDASGCWLWVGPRTGKGYSAYRGGFGHRVSYTWFVGPIPDGLTIDHLCRNRACVNPAHLDACTDTENKRRANRFDTTGKCKKGHVLADGNLGWQKRNGQADRLCLACRCLTRRRYLAKRGRTYMAGVRDFQGNWIRRDWRAA